MNGMKKLSVETFPKFQFQESNLGFRGKKRLFCRFFQSLSRDRPGFGKGPVVCLFFAVFLGMPLAAQGFDKTIAPEIKKAFSGAQIPVLRRRTPAADFTASRLDGTPVRLSGLKGKVVFLNFWATWCPPCQEEMPSIEALYRRFQGKDLEFLAVDIQEDKDEVAAFMKEYGLSFPAALDSTGRISAEYGIRGIPATFIIDREGGVIAVVVGSRDWNTPETAAALETLIAHDR
jgi:thiol-disulfide isomerase/thioredoxin